MSKSDIWMPLYIGDYMADTMHLSSYEHGPYLLLLMAYWRNGGPLPDDDKKLAAICRLSTTEFSAIRSVIAEFFVIGGGVWRNNRSDSEIKRWEGFKSDKEYGAAVANHQKYGTPIPERYAERYAERGAKRTLTDTPSPSPSPLPLTPSLPASSPEPKVKTLSASKPPNSEKQVDSVLQATCRTVWQTYSEAYKTRYGVNPVRNAKVNSAVKGFCQRIDGTESALVAGWFVGHQGQRYVAAGHVFGLLLADAEKLRTEWATGRIATTSQSRLADKTAGMGQIWKKLISESEQSNERTD